MAIRITRVYTRTGDQGTTRLVGGQETPKDHPRIEAYGTIDELNSVMGLARTAVSKKAAQFPELKKLEDILTRISHELFNLGSELATLPADLHPQQPRVTQEMVDRLEREMDEMNERLPHLKSFVLPGGDWPEAFLHQARTVCRRAERQMAAMLRAGEIEPVMMRYVNRLSDACFVWGRWAALTGGEREFLWDPSRVTPE
ncbi:MAG: Cob(I)yrinic acid a,c-diamide adenosyltransferase [Myxococcota bacterium]|nr:Cob(I)yrinic acid a,c-diamide adenosyltransferase [Myxococcota bacterium]